MPEPDEKDWKTWMRRASWRGRAAKKMWEHVCEQCLRKGYCERVGSNSMIVDLALNKGDCPDMINIWKRLLEEPAGIEK